MPTRPDADDPFFTTTMSHLATAPIPHTSVPFAPTELAVLQRWSQVYHSHRARCPVGPPPGMPAAVYAIFERLGGATPFATQQGASDYSTSAPSTQESTMTAPDDTEAFRPEAWSSGTDAQPTPGLYRSPDSEPPSSSSPTNTIRSTSARPTPVYNLGTSSVRPGSSPSYGALDQHMRALELKRGMKRSAAGHSRNKMNRTVSAPIKMSGSSSRPSSVGIRSSPLVGMKSSSPPRHSSPLVGLGSGPASTDAHDAPALFSTGQPLQVPGGGYQAYAAQTQAGTTAYAEGYSFSAGYDGDQSGYTDAPSALLDDEADKSVASTIPVPPAVPAPAAQPAAPATSAPAPATSTAAAVAAAVPKEKGKARTAASASERTDPNTMPDRNDPNVTIIDDPAALRGMRYEDFEPHMYIGRSALGTEYPRNLEPGAGHERIRCLLCKCGYAGPNGRSMWRRHVSQKHVILLAGKRGTVAKKKDGAPDETTVINNYMEKRERTLASKKRYASKKRMDQKLDRLAAQGFDVGKIVADEAKQLIRDLGGVADEDGDGDDDGDDEEDTEEESKVMPLQDVPPNSSEVTKPKLRLKPLTKPDPAASETENALPPSSPLSPVPATSVSVSPAEPTHPGPTFAFDTPGPANSTYLFSPSFDDDSRRYGVLGKAFGEDVEVLGKPFAEEIKLGGGKRVRAFKSSVRLDDDAFPILGSTLGLSSPLRIGRSRSVGAVESPTRGGATGEADVGETGSEPETPRTNAAKVAARRLQLFALESPVANVTPMRKPAARGMLSRSMTTPIMSTALGSHAALVMGQTPLADGEEELARALGLAPDIGRHGHHEHFEDSPVRKRKRGPNTPFPIFPSSKLRESETMVDEFWPSSPFVINTPAPAPKRARKDKDKDMGMDSYANEMIAGDLILGS